VLFATEAGREDTVREAIEQALSTGSVRGPDGAITRWRLHASQSSRVSAHEAEHAERLIRS
jgi:hypothetical protein